MKTKIESKIAAELEKAIKAKNPELGVAAYKQLVEEKAASELQDAVYTLSWAFGQLRTQQACCNEMVPEFPARFGEDDKLLAPAGYSENQILKRKEMKRVMAMLDEAITEAKTKGCLSKVNQIRKNPSLTEWAKDEQATP